MRAIVTGGASGIGAAVVSLLRSRDFRVIVFDRDVERREDAIRVDVTDAAGVEAAVADAVARLGGLDVLVNNAGIGAAGTVEDNSDEEWHRVYDVNVVGMVRVSRACLPALRVVVVRVDRQHLLGRGDRGPAAAGALQRDQGRRALADAGDGRRPRRRGHPRQLRHAGHGRHALGRPPARRRRGPRRPSAPRWRPASRWAASSARHEVAEAIAYLASPAAASTTGTVLAVDGGMQGLRLRNNT